MAQVDSENTISAPVDATRRRFLSQAAGVAVGATAAVVSPNVAVPADDRALLKLEELIFEQREKSAAYDDEIMRLSEIWTAESRRLYQEALDVHKRGGTFIDQWERWKIVSDMPESREHDRLCKLQEPFLAKVDALIKQMFATPAHTAEGRRAKLTVLLAAVLPDDWNMPDEATDWHVGMARQLMFEMVGGEPGERLRDQYA